MSVVGLHFDDPQPPEFLENRCRDAFLSVILSPETVGWAEEWPGVGRVAVRKSS